MLNPFLQGHFDWLTQISDPSARLTLSASILSPSIQILAIILVARETWFRDPNLCLSSSLYMAIFHISPPSFVVFEK